MSSLVVRLPEGGMDPAAADELVQAFRRFKAAGKAIYVHSQGLYASGIVTSTYMLGASGSQLWMQGGAPFEATGIASEEMFFGRAFAQYGIVAQFEQRGQYKSAVNPYLYSDYTPAHREAQLGWMNAVFDSTIASVAADRHLGEDVVRAALVGGPYDADGAMKAGLIDKVGQAEDMQAAALKAAGEGAGVVDMADYRPPSRGLALSAPGRSRSWMWRARSPTGQGGASLTGGTTVGSDDIAGAIRDAARDDARQSAIVLRISSRGGSDTASVQVAAAVQAARAARKPVVVSMGAYAASGAYWVSSQADYIYRPADHPDRFDRRLWRQVFRRQGGGEVRGRSGPADGGRRLSRDQCPGNADDRCAAGGLRGPDRPHL